MDRWRTAKKMKYIESKRRSILKTVSWRIWATVTTMILVYIFTGKLLIAISVGSIEVVAKIVLYFLHERLWNKIQYGRKSVEPFVLWFTGLSGAGKSTLAEKTFQYLKDRGLRVEELDGDVIRTVFPKTGFSKEDRDSHIRRVGFLASLLERNGVIVVSSFISPYKEIRSEIRHMCKNFIEIHVNAPIEVCEQRDVKGLYKKARAGEIKHFTGIDDPYEPPERPEIVINTSLQSVDESFSQLKKYFDNQLIQ